MLFDSFKIKEFPLFKVQLSYLVHTNDIFFTDEHFLAIFHTKSCPF